MILAGDIGGTHARLAFFDVVDGHFSLVSASVFPSREYRGLDEIVTKFVDSSNVRPDAACFGVAGPIRNGRVEASNLPWVVESKRLADELKLRFDDPRKIGGFHASVANGAGEDRKSNRLNSS